MNISTTEINELKLMTHHNDHVSALIKACEIYDLHHYRDMIKHIKKLHEMEGYLPHDLYKYFYSIYLRVMEAIEKKYGTVELEKVRACL